MDVLLSSVVLCIFLPWPLQASDLSERRCGGTPKTLRQDFIKSCGLTGYNPEFCELAWSKFTKAFAGKDPATVTGSDYDEYFGMLPVKVKPNESLFWSGTFEITDALSRDNVEIKVFSTADNATNRVHILGDQNLGIAVTSTINTDSSALLVHIGEEINPTLYWCGKEGGGIDYDTKNCDCTPVDTFRKRLSEEFAKSAQDLVFFLANGQSKNGAYSDQSLFATVELPNMRPDVVKRVAVMVVHKEGQGESCSKPYAKSLTLLRSTLEKRYGYGYSCYDIYGDPSDPNQTLRIAESTAGLIRKLQYFGKKYGIQSLEQELYGFIKHILLNPSWSLSK